MRSDLDHFDEVEIVFCGGGAKPWDTHLASRIVAEDADIFRILESRERRRRRREARHAAGS